MATSIDLEMAKQVVANAPGRIVVACINSPENITISGDVAVIDKVTAA